MVPIAAVLLVVLLGIPGCAGTPSPAPLPRIAALPVSVTDGVVKVGADPYSSGSRQKEVFGADLGLWGIIPIQIYLENPGDRPVQVKVSDISLVLPDGTRVFHAGARAVSTKLSRNGAMIVGTVAFGLPGGIAGYYAEEKGRGPRLDDYLKKELQNASLGRGESAHGFLYFIPPLRSTGIDSALLRFRIVYDDNSVSNVELALKELRYCPRALAENRDGQTGFNHR